MSTAFAYHRTAFISGTFADMVEWREHARAVLDKLGIHPIDLSRTSKSGHPTTESYINTDLDTTHTLIGIYGLRYGSLMNNGTEPPSWSHHEYSRHRWRISLFPPGFEQPDTLILCPAQNSEAMMLINRAADEVYNSAKLSQEDCDRDRRLQRDFLDVIVGNRADFPGQSGQTALPGVSVARQSRIIETFASGLELELAIALHFGKVRQQHRIVLDPGTSFGQGHAAGEPPPPMVKLTAKLLQRLAPAKRPAGLCLMAPKIGDVTSTNIAKAVATANPWEVEDADGLYTSRGGSVLDVLKDLAAREFNVEGDDIAQLAQGIAAKVTTWEEPVMFRIAGLLSGTAERFITDAWPALEESLRLARAKSGKTDAGLLLVLCADSASFKFKAVCQTTPTATTFDKPILLDADQLDLPQGGSGSALNRESLSR